MLTGFFSALFGLIRWAAVTALPVMLSTFVVGLFVKAGLAIGSMFVIYASAEYLKNFAIQQLSAIGSGTVGVQVLDMMAMFGILEGISLVISTALAKATWLMIQPSLTWLTTPSQ